MAKDGNDKQLRALQLENDLLRSFWNTSKDALWCIEFVEPVDLKAPDLEIIRQVFENECVWRMCNAAMARLYHLPENLDFNKQNVRFVFPRNNENEEFIRKLIASDFNTDGVISLDQDYSGRYVRMENDVRAKIDRQGMMTRMMGAVRNISQHKVREQELLDQVETMSAVLSAIPDPVLVVGGGRKLLAANTAFEQLAGWKLDDVVGRNVDSVLRIPDSILRDDAIAVDPGDPKSITLTVFSALGRERPCRAHVSAIDTGQGDQSLVITLRWNEAHEARPATASADRNIHPIRKPTVV